MVDQVILLDCWPSAFGMRVRIVLAEKGIEYEHREEDLQNKSPLLLQMNPVHKKIPVLIHKGRPICESLLIIQYIDEAWKDKAPLLPSDPYQRAQARFWADFVDEKIAKVGRMIWTSKREEQDAAKEEFIGNFKVLERELGEKKFFAGETIGYVDVALVTSSAWFKVYETFLSFSIGEECPKLMAWSKRCLETPSVSKSLADQDKVLEFVTEMRKTLGVD